MQEGCRGLIVTSRVTEKECNELYKEFKLGGKERFDFCSRFFAPHLGIDEDPCTGSAHCALAPYWSKKMDGKKSFRGVQMSERKGIVGMTLQQEEKTVILRGTASCVVEGRIASDASR